VVSLANAVIFVPTAGGTTDWTYSSAVQGYCSPALAGMVNGATYRYRAESLDLSQWEIGVGVYNSGTGVITRRTVLYNSSGTGTASGQSGAGTKINFTSAPNVGIVELAEDLRLQPAPQGRLTLQTGTPVMTTTQSAKTTIYYTPYLGSMIPLFDGTNWWWSKFSELSVATTDTTKNPAAIGASKVNDWFVWDDAGTLRLSHGPDWTSDTARSAGTALTLQDGIYVNSVAITNGPAASRGTYVGTTRSNASSQLDWIFGTAAAGGGMASLNVWNMYNRVDVATEVRDSTVTWTYTSAVWRSLNGSNTNRINFVSGLAEDGILVTGNGRIQSGANLAASFYGVGLDSNTARDLQCTNVLPGSAQASLAFSRHWAPQLGYHFAQAMEASDGTNTYTFVGNVINQSLGLRMRM